MKEYIFEIYEEATVDGGRPSKMKEELVRCKDCKYMTEHYDTDGNAPYWICSEWDSGTDYDGYCHYGERKEEVRLVPERHGKWIESALSSNHVTCSECLYNNYKGRMVYRRDYAKTLDYCPNCGAKMDLDEVNDEDN